MSQSHVPAELRRLVRGRAGGRCEYCQAPEAFCFVMHEVDHIFAEKHGGETSAENLALCCTLCNRRKGTDLASIDPLTGEVTPLFHPRRQRWGDHFRFIGPMIEALTDVGRATARLLGFDAEARVAERMVWAMTHQLTPGKRPDPDPTD